MFATGDLGDDALKKIPSSEDESEKSAKCAVGLGFDGGLESFPPVSIGTWEFTNGVTCPVPIGAAAKTFRLGLDLRESLSALFDGEVGFLYLFLSHVRRLRKQQVGAG